MQTQVRPYRGPSVCIGLLMAWLLSACHTSSRPDASPPPVPVLVSTVQSVKSTGTLVLSGSIEASTTVEVGFPNPGKVTQVAVVEGQPVRKGQLLAVQDASAVTDNLEAATASLAQAQDAFDRATIMNNRGSLTPVDYQKAMTALEQAKIQHRLATKNTGDARLYAPMSGVLARRNVEPGEQVSPGMPQFSLVSLQPVKAVASVPEGELGGLKLGQSAQVTIPALNLTVSGNVSELGVTADPASRTFALKVNLDNPGLRIKPGMVALLTLTGAQRATTQAKLALPGDAILHDPDGSSYVFVVDPQKHRAFKRTVSVGDLAGDNVEITAGLTPRDQVVTAGQQGLQNGSPVTLRKTTP